MIRNRKTEIMGNLSLGASASIVLVLEVTDEVEEGDWGDRGIPKGQEKVVSVGNLVQPFLCGLGCRSCIKLHCGLKICHESSLASGM